MSRSYKKTPVYKSRFKDGKKHANRAVRNNTDISSAKAHHKRVYDSYDVVDYIFYEPYARYMSQPHWYGENGTRDRWERMYYRK